MNEYHYYCNKIHYYIEIIAWAMALFGPGVATPMNVSSGHLMPSMSSPRGSYVQLHFN